MELALYDPAGGYYRSAAARPGRDGDFLTAPETHPIFGAALARGIAEVWDRLGRPDAFVLREYGAGTGTLALAILDRLRRGRLGARGRRSATTRSRSSRVASRPSPRGLGRPGRADVLVDAGRTGSPDRRGRPRQRGPRRAARPTASWSATAACARSSSARTTARFVDVEAEPTTPALAARLAAEGIELAEGQRAEICLAVEPWMAEAAAGLAPGPAPADRLRPPGERALRSRAGDANGTLLAYLRQRAHDDPYRHVGRQDLTAHVDVTAVERAAARGRPRPPRDDDPGRVPGRVSARRRCCRRSRRTRPRRWRPTSPSGPALMRLLDPAATGRFRVMGFGREWPDGPPLGGLRLPAPQR